MEKDENLLRKTLNTPFKVGMLFMESLEVFSSFAVIDNENVEFKGILVCDYTEIGNSINICIVHDNGDEYALLIEFTDYDTLYDYVTRMAIQNFITKMIATVTDENNYLEIFYLNFKKND